MLPMNIIAVMITNVMLQEGNMYYGVMLNLSEQMVDIEDALGYPVKELLISMGRWIL